MTWAATLYACLGYYHFRKTLQACEGWDGTGTVLLNATLAIAIGPLLLAPALAIAAIDRMRQ